MKEKFVELIENIPDYSTFLTLEELDASSFRLAERFPDVASVFSIGQTKEGREIYCLKIGEGSKNALMFGCPHPNEPIGTMMLEYFSEKLAEDAALREELDYTWYIVKAWDADGLKKNERWLKGPYNISNYSRYFFRPAGHQQVDWTFPVDYKELHFHKSIPETLAMMDLIDRIKPHFIYSLHNAGFGGVYWYISDELEGLYDDMRGAAHRVNIPLNLGEPEVPWCKELSPAVYQALGIEQDYDYMERYGEEDIAELINAGNCSESYARERYGSFTLLTELPYFYDERIMDNSESDKVRRDCILEKLDRQKEHDERVKSFLNRVENAVSPDNQYRMALEAFTKNSENKGTRNMVQNSPEYARKATVAEEFDSNLMSRFYSLLSLGMVIGMCEHELERRRIPEGGEEYRLLSAIIREAESIHLKETEYLEAELRYEVVPIRKLVSIQLECGLLVSDYLKDKSPINSKLRRFLEMPHESSPKWLDDRHIAYLRHDRDGNHIWKVDLETGKKIRLTEEEVRIWSFRCNLASGDIYYAMDESGSECEQIFRLKPCGERRQLTDDPGVRHLFGGVSEDGKCISYASNKRAGQTFDIWKMDAETGAAQLVREHSDNYNWPADAGMSPDGRYLLYNKLRGESDNALWVTDLETGESRRIPNDDRISAETQPIWKHHEHSIYFLSDRDSNFMNVWHYDLRTDEMKKVYEYGWDVERLSLSRDDRYLAVFVNEDGYTHLHIYDLESGEEMRLDYPQGVLSGYRQPDWSPTGHRLVLAHENAQNPSGILLLDIDRNTCRRISDIEVDKEDAAKLVLPELRDFVSFDGLRVPYWLYVPAGMEKKNLPVLIEIHGGPEGQELPIFEPFIQYLLSEGIAVVAPNVRGSTGYGKEYTHLDDVEKRLDSVKDIEFLVQHLVSSGIADVSRLAVSGTSYGGFMTLSCAARLPKLWACAVDTVGMYDLVTFLENTADYRRPHRESEYGTLAHHRELLREVSPVSKIKDITAPMMIIQGRNDPRVPVTEAEQAVEALRALGREVEYLCYDDEGHGIAKLRNRLDCYPKVADFVKKHLKIQ